MVWKAIKNSIIYMHQATDYSIKRCVEYEPFHRPPLFTKIEILSFAAHKLIGPELLQKISQIGILFKHIKIMIGVCSGLLMLILLLPSTTVEPSYFKAKTTIP